MSLTTHSKMPDIKTTNHSPLPVPGAIVVGGTVAIDHVKTPGSEGENLLGGSAAYAALAASFFSKDVHLVGIVGRDFPAEHLQMLEKHGVSLDGIERSEGESFTWSGEYMENMNDRVTHRVGLNVLEDWQVKVPAAAAAAPIVVLANMSPDNQLQMLDECAQATAAGSPAPFVIADTMDLWINIANERLHEVLQRLDLLVINESEAREFAGTANLVVAGRRLLEKGPRFVVIKLGEFGAMLFGRDAGGEIPAELTPDSFFRCAAFPLHEITDPTGAGDTFLGALAGHLATLNGANGALTSAGPNEPNSSASPPPALQTGSAVATSPPNSASAFSFEQIRQAVVQGSVLASFTCEAFSTRRLESLESADLADRHVAFRLMSSWE